MMLCIFLWAASGVHREQVNGVAYKTIDFDFINGFCFCFSSISYRM